MNCSICGIGVDVGERFCKMGHSLRGMKLESIQVSPKSPDIPGFSDVPGAHLVSELTSTEPVATTFVTVPQQPHNESKIEAELSPTFPVEVTAPLVADVSHPESLPVETSGPFHRPLVAPVVSEVALATAVSAKEENKLNSAIAFEAVTTPACGAQADDFRSTVLPEMARSVWKMSKHRVMLGLASLIPLVGVVMWLIFSGDPFKLTQVVRPTMAVPARIPTSAASEVAGILGGQSQSQAEAAASAVARAGAVRAELKVESPTGAPAAKSVASNTNLAKPPPKPISPKAGTSEPVVTYSRSPEAPQLATAEPAQPAQPQEPARSAARTINAIFAERSAIECQPGLMGLLCRESIKFSVCSGHWSEAPQLGSSICVSTRIENQNR